MSAAYSLLIVEALNTQAALQVSREFLNTVQHLSGEAAYQYGDVLSEQDGLTIVLLSVWASRASADLFEHSRMNRVLAARISNYIMGVPAVRIFTQVEGGTL